MSLLASDMRLGIYIEVSRQKVYELVYVTEKNMAILIGKDMS